MSWNISVPPVAVDEFDEAVQHAQETYRRSQEGNLYMTEQLDSGQLDAAVEAAKALVSSGMVGTGTVRASLVGHANPDHEPAEGFAPETVTVTVTCTDQYEKPAPEYSEVPEQNRVQMPPGIEQLNEQGVETQAKADAGSENTKAYEHARDTVDDATGEVLAEYEGVAGVDDLPPTPIERRAPDEQYDDVDPAEPPSAEVGAVTPPGDAETYPAAESVTE